MTTRQSYSTVYNADIIEFDERPDYIAVMKQDGPVLYDSEKQAVQFFKSATTPYEVELFLAGYIKGLARGEVDLLSKLQRFLCLQD